MSEIVESSGTSQLHVFASEGKLSLVSRILKYAGAQIDPNAADSLGLTPLHYAARHGHKHVAHELVKHGARIDAVDRDNETALLKAAFHGHDSTVKLLLDNHADMAHADSRGATALHNACAQGHYSVVSVLVNSGANVNAKNARGMTPLSKFPFCSNLSHVNSWR